MRMLRISTLLIFFVIVCKLVSFAQIKFTVHANFGISNFIEKNEEPSIEVGNRYTRLPSYIIGTEGLYNFDNSNIGVISGINFSLLSAQNQMPYYNDTVPFAPPYTGPTEWNERLYSLSIPVKVNYELKKWININAGFANTFHLKNEKISDKKINIYALNFVGGLDFVIKKKFIIGLMYYRDLLPSMRLKIAGATETYNIKYSVEQITVKIEYVINSK